MLLINISIYKYLLHWFIYGKWETQREKMNQRGELSTSYLQTFYFIFPPGTCVVSSLSRPPWLTSYEELLKTHIHTFTETGGVKRHHGCETQRENIQVCVKCTRTFPNHLIIFSVGPIPDLLTSDAVVIFHIPETPKLNLGSVSLTRIMYRP